MSSSFTPHIGTGNNSSTNNSNVQPSPNISFNEISFDMEDVPLIQVHQAPMNFQAQPQAHEEQHVTSVNSSPSNRVPISHSSQSIKKIRKEANQFRQQDKNKFTAYGIPLREWHRQSISSKKLFKRLFGKGKNLGTAKSGLSINGRH